MNRGHSIYRVYLQSRRGFQGQLANSGRVEMVSAAGIEPATHALKGRCSTN